LKNGNRSTDPKESKMLDAETQEVLDELHASFGAEEMLCSKRQGWYSWAVPADPEPGYREILEEEAPELA